MSGDLFSILTKLDYKHQNVVPLESISRVDTVDCRLVELQWLDISLHLFSSFWNPAVGIFSNVCPFALLFYIAKFAACLVARSTCMEALGLWRMICDHLWRMQRSRITRELRKRSSCADRSLVWRLSMSKKLPISQRPVWSNGRPPPLTLPEWQLSKTQHRATFDWNKRWKKKWKTWKATLPAA